MLFGEGTMKLWILVGLLTAAAAPAAYATEETTPTAESDRHVGAAAHSDATPLDARPRKETLMMTPSALAESTWTAPPPAPVAAPAPTPRARKHPRPMEAGVPDSMLIGGSGAL